MRQLFPAHEASWRIPTLLLTGMGGMAAGSWLAGRLYDHFGFYAPAFATGLGFNLLNASLDRRPAPALAALATRIRLFLTGDNLSTHRAG